MSAPVPVVLSREDALERHQTRVVMFWAGLVLAVLGLVASGYGFVQLHVHGVCEATPRMRVVGCPDVDAWPFYLGFGLFGVGLLLVQFRDAGKAFGFVSDRVPLLQAFGRRKSDQIAAATVIAAQQATPNLVQAQAELLTPATHTAAAAYQPDDDAEQYDGR